MIMAVLLRRWRKARRWAWRDLLPIWKDQDPLNAVRRAFQVIQGLPLHDELSGWNMLVLTGMDAGIQ